MNIKKPIVLLILLGIITFSCKAQRLKAENISMNSEMNYVFARIYDEKPYTQILFDGSYLMSVFKFSDSKSTPENFSEGHEFLDSYIISIVPDGDYYTTSKLFKIEGLNDPKILDIKEQKYPHISLKIEHGFPNERKIDIVIVEAPK